MKVRLLPSTIFFALVLALSVYFFRSNKSVGPEVGKVIRKSLKVQVKGTQKLLDPLPDNATEEQKTKKYRDYQAAAKEAPYLEIKDCKPNPVLIKILDQPNLVIKNSGDEERQMWFDDQHYTIPAHDQLSVSLDFAFKKKLPRYWYVCDLHHRVISGMIWVGMGDDR